MHQPLKTSVTISIDASILSQIREEAQAEHKNLSDYFEKLFCQAGYRPYNELTIRACEAARQGKTAGKVDTDSVEAFIASIIGDEKTKWRTKTLLKYFRNEKQRLKKGVK